MKYLLFLLLPVFGLSQQTIEICDNSVTYNYAVTTDIASNIEWYCNGLYYYGNEISITWNEPGTYEITASAIADGCPSNIQTYTVTVIECDPLIYWIPNTFTPDGNEFNQLWGPVFTSGYSVDHFELYVTNRWGEKIWESHDPAARWDGTYNGKKCLDGVYTWVVKFDLLNTDERRVDHGHVTIIR